MRALPVIVLLLLGAACGPAAPSPASGAGLSVKLTDNAMVLDRPIVAGGQVNVTVANTGLIAHSIDLIKTDIPHDRLAPDPKDATRVQVSSLGTSMGRVAPGTELSFTVDLPPGSYVFLCSQPAHYLIGMHAPLTVK